jgi:tape measure domain-containing protein
LSLSIEDQADAIRLVSKLTELYGGQIDKVTNAFTSALESGKVTQATLNQLTSQGIPIQEALASKYKTSRDNLLQMAKDGKISVQDLTDTLVNLGNTSDTQVTKTVSGWTQAWKNIERAASLSLQAVTAVFNAITSEGVTSSGNIASTFSSMYVALVEGAISMGVRVSSVLANIARGIANTAATFRLGGVNIVAGAATAAFKNVEKTFNRINTNLQAIDVGQPVSGGVIGGITAPGQLPPSGGGGGGARRNAVDEAARLEEQIQSRLRALTREAELTEQITTLKELQAAAEFAGDKELQARLAGEEKIVNILQSAARELDDATDSRVRQEILINAESEILQARTNIAR